MAIPPTTPSLSWAKLNSHSVGEAASIDNLSLYTPFATIGSAMKFVGDRPFADPDLAARKLVEFASAVEPVQDARIHIEKINGPFLQAGGSPAEFVGALNRAISKGWLLRHESGTYVKFTQAGAELFA
jgi:hypothetical protein